MMRLSDILATLPDLTDDDLRRIITDAQNILESRAGDDPAIVIEPERVARPEPVGGDNGARRRGRGWWLEIKTIKGHQYLYRRWREGGRQRSEYVGKITSNS